MTELLFDIDKDIHECNKCVDMVEKFPDSKTVSEGNYDLVILGEAPANNGWRKSGIAWYDIDHNLLPSGEVLQKLLYEIGLKIEDAYFLEAIKCYPKTRKCLGICGENCRDFLNRQLEVIKPRFILSLGDAATRLVLDIKYDKFKDVVGKKYDVNGYTVIPIYHPSPVSPLSYKGNIGIMKSLHEEGIKKLLKRRDK